MYPKNTVKILMYKSGFFSGIFFLKNKIEINNDNTKVI